MTKMIVNILILLGAVPAFAEEMATQASTGGVSALGAALTISIAVLGGAIGQGLIGSSAMEGMARNPQAKDAMFVPMIVGLALIESLVIYALLIAFVKY
ncbi:MAG: ATP synthase F0 subunit C [Bdellovibrionales bacterium]|nr:ATP synthase F0 subunit C [Bdellovibrionales bacterium]